MFKCSNNFLTCIFKKIVTNVKRAQLSLPFPSYTWDFTLSCSILNENKLFRSHSVLTLENIYVNCQKKSGVY